MKIKTEGGSGGKRGHSNMCHWFFTEEIKTAARHRRRAESRRLERDAISHQRLPVSQD